MNFYWSPLFLVFTVQRVLYRLVTSLVVWLINLQDNISLSMKLKKIHSFTKNFDQEFFLYLLVSLIRWTPQDCVRENDSRFSWRFEFSLSSLYTETYRLRIHNGISCFKGFSRQQGKMKVLVLFYCLRKVTSRCITRIFCSAVTVLCSGLGKSSVDTGIK